MRILVVGNGGREHAIIKKISQNPNVTNIYAIPGNGGISEYAECIDIDVNDVAKIALYASYNNIDFVIVGPDNPLALGLIDELEKYNIKSFGPNKRAALIESSKIFSKNLMKKYNIPTAKYEIFDEYNKAIEYLDEAPIPTVIKADGLALGKGVVIANTREEAKQAVKEMMQDKIFGESGKKIVIEEFLTGPEVSVLSFTDGKTIIPMISSMDHKRVFDGDKGLNTGGMGVIAPNPYYTEEIAKECMQKIFLPTINAMNKENRPFKGCLYFGLMLTEQGPKVIEYNCRFGDPETQVVLPLLESDLLDIMLNIYEEKLNESEINFSKKSACCVVMASGGYPEKYKTGYEINISNEITGEIFIAGAHQKDGILYTSGGRVLGVTQLGNDLKEAIDNAYNDISKIEFKNAHYRKDIGAKVLKLKL